ncbi:F-type conjugal transfer protein TrbF [Escherichia coli]|nr:F-type conjugal transfer protein TrbF [Escherichia coli]ELT9951434.1 F-type conjugal transfer protein TrbF [Escherichia coli]
MNYQRKLIMKENKKNQGFKIRKIKRDIEHGCDNAIKHFGIFVVFFIAGLLLWHGMHAILSACIDSWKTDPELNNSIYMWNILMYAIPYTLYALAVGFLVTFFLSPMYESIGIFLLKCRMRRENKLREGKNDATH